MAVRHSQSSHWFGFIFTIMFVSLRLILENIPEGDEQTFKNIKTVKGYALRVVACVEHISYFVEEKEFSSFFKFENKHM